MTTPTRITDIVVSDVILVGTRHMQVVQIRPYFNLVELHAVVLMNSAGHGIGHEIYLSYPVWSEVNKVC